MFITEFRLHTTWSSRWQGVSRVCTTVITWCIWSRGTTWSTLDHRLDDWLYQHTSLSRLSLKLLLIIIIISSTRLSRPNKASLNVCPYLCTFIRTSTRPSTKVYPDLNKIWCVGRGRWVIHDGMPYDLIQIQSHRGPFQSLSTPPFNSDTQDNI